MNFALLGMEQDRVAVPADIIHGIIVRPKSRSARFGTCVLTFVSILAVKIEPAAERLPHYQVLAEAGGQMRPMVHDPPQVGG